MTAPRDHRACGAPLSGDVRWCLRCYEPVRELAPREPQLPPLPTVHEPVPEPRMSRWHAGPTTFGPVGRISITLVVLWAGPWGSLGDFSGAADALTLWYLLGYTMLAVLILRHVWRKERVSEPDIPMREGLRARIARRMPRLGRPIPPIVVFGGVAVIALASLVSLWVNLDSVGRYYLVAAGAAAGTGVFLIVWNEL